MAYAFSPIDLIPDFILVLGYLDDLILVPVGIYLILRLIPAPVLARSRLKADEWTARNGSRPRSCLAAAALVALWFAVAWVLWWAFF